MSLQVWLPLNGNLNNNGVANVTVVNKSAIIDDNGKIGKCYDLTGSPSRICISEQLSYTYPLSVSCWICPSNATSSTTQYILSYSTDSDGFAGHIIGLAIRNTKLSAVGGGASYEYASISNNTWYHVAVTIDSSKKYILYINGQNVKSGTCADTPDSKWFTIGARSNSATGGIGGASYYFYGKINDVRLYNHALSQKEVKEISKALVLHYPLNGNGRTNENLFRDSAFNISELTGNSSDLTTTLGYYNGAASNHTFENGIDTILLNSTSNIGINFKCKATDINLDTSAYYTISCEAKCSKSGATLDIGLSYYNNSNSWVWRGGTNPQSFNAVDTWQKFKLTFKPDSDTQYIGYCFTCKSGGNNTLSLRYCKMEKGSVATPWMPNSADDEYSELGYNSTTELDISGNNYNGIKMGSLDYNKDTARFRVSTVFNGTDSYIEADSLPTETKTISVWCKTSWEIPSDHKMIMHDKQTGIAIGITKKGYIDTYIGSSSGGLGSYIKLSTTNYTANIWNHIVIVKTGEDTRDVYINSIKAIPSEVNYWAGDLYKLNIGVRHSNGSYTNYFDGQLSDFRAYATALSADDVKELYNQVALSSSLIT